jgi:hypothetical protein
MVQKLFVSGVNALNSVSLDIREDDRLVGLFIDQDILGPVDTTDVSDEISFLSTPSISSNDTTGVLAEVRFTIDLVTSGMMHGGKSVYIPMDEPVQAGERLFLHHSVGGSTPSAARCRVFIYLRGKPLSGQSGRRAERRR